jgi:hypothetical protein
MDINLDGRTFTTETNTSNGEVDSRTRFSYHQRERFVWAEYSGGSIVAGHLMGVIRDDDSLDMRYHHLNDAGEVLAGTCRSVIGEEDGRVVLDERWQWLTGDRSTGTSRVVEVLDT